MFQIDSPQHKKMIAGLTEIRRREKLKKIDLSKKVGMYDGFVSKYETGHRELSLMEFLKLCEVLNVSPVDVLYYAGFIRPEDWKHLR